MSNVYHVATSTAFLFSVLAYSVAAAPLSPDTSFSIFRNSYPAQMGNLTSILQLASTRPGFASAD